MEYLDENIPVNQNQPLLSVCVQTYQHNNYIKECLDGILMQKTSFSYEIILGEDESTDGTREICVEYANKHPDKIRLFLRSRKDVIYINGNPTGRFNLMENFKAAKGKYIALCDGDDYWSDPYKLQKQVGFLESNPEYVLCFCNALVKDETGLFCNIKLYSDFPWNGLNPLVKEYSLNDLIENTLCPTSSVVFKRPDNFKLPDWFLSLPFVDMPLFILIASQGKIKYFNETMLFYRRHDNSVSRINADNDTFIIGRIKMYLELFDVLTEKYTNVVLMSLIKQIDELKKKSNLSRLHFEDLNKLQRYLCEYSFLLKEPKTYNELRRHLKLTFVAYGPNQINGPNIWLQRILPELTKRGFQPQVLFLMSSDKPCEIVNNLRHNGVKCITILRQQYTEQNIHQILTALKSNPPDIFVPNVSVPAYYAARWVKEAGIPSVGILHSDDNFHHELIEYFVSGIVEYRLSGLVCVSKYLEEFVRVKDDANTEILRCSCGVEVPINIVTEPKERLNLVYAGRLIQRQKRIFDVINSLKNVVSEVPDTFATIYGDDREGGKVIETIRNLNLSDKLQYGGLLKDDEVIPALLKHHVFVLLSDYEGMSISLMEAMGCGLVPICTKTRSGATEIIRHNENGLLVDNREDDFISAIERLKYEKGLWARLSKAARETIKKEYTIDVCADRWTGLLNTLAEQSKFRSIIRIPNLDEIILPPLKISENGISREDKRMLRQTDNFVNPILKPDNIDLYFVRSSIVRALKEVLLRCHGTLLDIGCGKMPYKEYILANSEVIRYVGLDIEKALVYDKNIKPDFTWDGIKMPFNTHEFDCAIATEVLEHCPEPEIVLKETYRVLKQGGIFFFTVPFLWNLHEAPHDEYRYTPFSLERHLKNAGFADVEIKATGGWHAAMAQMLGLWLNRSPISARKRKILSVVVLPVIRKLIKMDKLHPVRFKEGQMITGLYGTAKKVILNN